MSSCGLQVMINSRGLVYSVVLLLGSVALTVSSRGDTTVIQPYNLYDITLEFKVSTIFPSFKI